MAEVSPPLLLRLVLPPPRASTARPGSPRARTVALGPTHFHPREVGPALPGRRVVPAPAASLSSLARSPPPPAPLQARGGVALLVEGRGDVFSNSFHRNIGCCLAPPLYMRRCIRRCDFDLRRVACVRFPYTRRLVPGSSLRDPGGEGGASSASPRHSRHSRLLDARDARGTSRFARQAAHTPPRLALPRVLGPRRAAPRLVLC